MKLIFTVILCLCSVILACDEGEVELWDTCYNIETTTTLGLYNQGLTGEIPSELYQLINLEYINLGINDLTGEISSSVSNLINLQTLNLEYNNLTGEIPSEIGGLSDLENLDLGGNNFTGSIPEELGSLINLKVLILYNNELTGSIPIEISNLTNLEHLSFYNNNLTGEIPAELGNLISLTTILNLGFNNLTGAIPSEIGNLLNLESLKLMDNQLTGEIPSNLGNLSNLKELNLDDNNLTGGIPDQLGNLEYLEVINFERNDLDGIIPSTLWDLYDLEILNLNSNDLEGEIPSSISNLVDLHTLNLSNNNFNGELPFEICTLTDASIIVSDNQFCPIYPQCIVEEFTDLNSNGQYDEGEPYIDYDGDDQYDNNIGEQDISNCSSSNCADGEVELWGICYNIQTTTVIDLSSSGLSGSIPPTIGELTNLYSLSLQNNNLSGEIPSELFNIAGLFYINLYGNNLSGLIPSNVCNWIDGWYLQGQNEYFWSNNLAIFNNNLCPPYPDCILDVNGEIFVDLTLQDTSNCQLSSDFIYLPKKYSISSVYPNPFNPSTNFQYEIPDFSMVDIFIYDLNGKVVEQLVSSYHSPGIYNILWDASNFSSGIYILSMQSNDFIYSQKISLTK